MADDERERQAEALKRMMGGDGGGEKPAKPVPPPASAAMFRQARPAEPAANETPAREARPARPASPPPRATPQIPPADAAARRLASVSTNESDTLPIYVPPTSLQSSSTAMTPHDLTAARAIERKRTFIPILLTCGALLLAIGGARWVVADDSAFKLLTAGMSLGVLACGFVSLLLAVLNMLQVRDHIAAGASESRQAQAP